MSPVAELPEPPATADVAPIDFAPRLAWALVRAVLRSAMVAVAFVAGLDASSPSWLAWLLPVLLLPGTAIPWLRVVGLRRAPWALRVDETGVRWSPAGRVLPWSDVAAIEVHVARGLRRLLPHVNQVLLVTRAQADFARRARTKPMGHAVRLAHVRATPEALVAAFRPFTQAPVGLRRR